MAETTPRLALPLLQSGQAQKEVTHNEALAALDTLVHLAVVGVPDNTPPSSPTVGASWIVGAAPTGIWTTYAGAVATFDEAGWRYRQPPEGCIAWLTSNNSHAIYSSGTWHIDAWPVTALRVRGKIMLEAEPVSLSPVSGGSVIDVQARAAISNVINVLRAMGIAAPG